MRHTVAHSAACATMPRLGGYNKIPIGAVKPGRELPRSEAWLSQRGGSARACQGLRDSSSTLPHCLAWEPGRLVLERELECF